MTTADVVWVELDVFSGRPNPTWALTPDQVRALLAHVARLEPASPCSSSRDQLGYRGVTAYNLPQLRRARVSGGCVELSTEPTTWWIDRDQAVERWLIGTGRSVEQASLIDGLLAEFGEPRS